MPGAFRLGTRGSKLALVQAEWAKAAMLEAHPSLEVELVIIKTQGDQDSETPLSSAGGIGLFTKALEEALEKGSIDGAVHSLKDLPTRQPKSLCIAAVGKREDWRDCLLSPKAKSLKELPQGARLGTGSPRRRAQLLRLRPDLKFVELRGNVDTRIRKLGEGEAEGAILAAAGLNRLGRLKEAAVIFGEEMLPAPGQGFLAFEARSDDPLGIALLRPLDDPIAHTCAEAERALLDELGAGCHAPVAALARMVDAELRLKAFVQNRDGRIFEAELSGEPDPEGILGRRLAKELISKGAERTK